MKRSVFVLLAGILLIPAFLSAKDNKQHLDPYVLGPPNEAKLIQEVRHKLVTLPYFGVFDDIGFNVSGSTVTLQGQVTQPVLKKEPTSTGSRTP